MVFGPGCKGHLLDTDPFLMDRHDHRVDSGGRNSSTRKSTADLRYRLLCGVLVLFVLAIGVTFFIETSSTSPSTAIAQNGAQVAFNPDKVNLNYTGTLPDVNPVSKAVSFLDLHVDIIFLVWLLFFLMKSLKMMGGLLYIQRMRHYKVHEVAEEFKQKIALFSRQIGIGQTIRLVQSELVSVPVAVGWLKPVILLPMGIILQLSPAQLDSILWHELAHIRRRDYLVNILQGLVETLFFFNPGLMWLSSLIRAEREACCDDMVLSRVGQKANYLEALLSFGYSECKRAGLAMGLGSGNQLRDRLKRMISKENKKLNVAEKAILSVGVILLTAFTTIPKTSQAVKHLASKFTAPSVKLETHAIAIKAADVKPVNNESIGVESARQVEEKSPSVLADTSINFVSVLFKNSDADLANNDIKAEDDKNNYYHFVVADNKLVAMEINDTKINESKLPDYEYMIRNIDRVVVEKRHVTMADIVASKAKSPNVKVKNKDLLVKWKYKADWQKKDSVYTKGDNPPKAGADKEPTAKYDAMLKRRQDDSLSYNTQLQRALNVINDLVKDKVAPDAAAVKWFGLTETEFIVNGQKQPAEMQQRYMAKYGVRKNYGLYYGPVQMQGTGVFIDAKADNGNLQMQNFQRERGLRFKTHGDELAENQRQFQQLGPGKQDDWNSANTRSPVFWVKSPLKSTDSILWAREQLVKQQAAFAAAQNESRRKLIMQQQLFAAEQDDKRKQLLKQQNILLAEQAKKVAQQQSFVAEQTARIAQWRAKDAQSIDSKIVLPQVVANITGDLVNENILKDKSDLHGFRLTNTSLIVNDKTQPEELHQKLKSKYLSRGKYPSTRQIFDDPNFGIHYNPKTGGMGIGLTDGPPEND